MKRKTLKCIVLVLLLSIGVIFESNAYAEKANKTLARKMAVATYYEQILNQKYGMAYLSIQGTSDDTLQISMVRITEDRIREVLALGVYGEAKKAKFKNIKFIDINQKATFVNLK